jgi:2-dehydropantoate 2-reductase
MNGFPWWYFHRLPEPLRSLSLPQLDRLAAPWLKIGVERVIGGVSYPACTVIRPGVIRVASFFRGVTLGEPTGEASTRVSRIAAGLRAGGVEVEVTPRIRDTVWTKLVNNLASGPMSILSQSAVTELHGRPACADAIRRCRAEAAAIAKALGCDVAAQAEAQGSGFGAVKHKSSIVQDLERGRAMEIDALYATPLEIARLLGVATPTLDLLVELAQLRARAAGLYG